MKIDSRVALVTGAAGFIGNAICQRLAGEGAHLVLVDIIESVREKGLDGAHEVLSIVADATKADQVDCAVAAGIHRFGRLDIVVNAVGGESNALIHEMTDEAWEQVLRVNLTTAFLCTRAAARVMREQRYGRIVYISSTAKDGVPWFPQAGVGRANYAAAKMGLIGLARASAAELAPYGITVNCVVPGPILTPRTAEGFRRLEEDQRVRAKPLDVIPLGRYGSPADVANAVVFLVSDEAAYITGHELYVSGGLE